jgi:anti-sigma regulatory factor (Ser/Thr protein kinase)
MESQQMNDHAPAQAAPAQCARAWPLQTDLELPAVASAVPCARAHVRAVARQWGLADLGDTAELLASELVTNALKASGSLPTTADPAIVHVVRIWLASDHGCLVIRVWDGSDSMPVRTDTSPDEEGGRGLLLVEALGSAWGAYRTAIGKVVWVQISPPGT